MLRGYRMFKKSIQLCLVFMALMVQVALAQIREIPNPNLPDIAMATFDRMGPVIYFNPIIAQRVGPHVAEFFRAHEYGHHNLNHIQRGMMTDPFSRRWVRRGLEKEADIWATQTLFQQGNTMAIEAAVRSFRSGTMQPSPNHPHPIQRASYISQYYHQLRASANLNRYDRYPAQQPSPYFPRSDVRIPDSPSPVDDPYYR